LHQRYCWRNLHWTQATVIPTKSGPIIGYVGRVISWPIQYSLLTDEEWERYEVSLGQDNVIMNSEKNYSSAFLDTTRPLSECIHCHGKIFTKPLPSKIRIQT
jgi:hypothetical protein